VKVASTSLEIYLSQFCAEKDTLTPLFEEEEKFKKKLNLLTAQNYKLKKKSFGIKNFLNLNFNNEVTLESHSSLKKVFKTKIGKLIKNYFFFAFIRNPFDWIVSFFWWYLFYFKKMKINDINKLKQKKLDNIFNKFLEEECDKFFILNKNIITNKHVNIKVFKYEEFNKNLKYIKKKLKLSNERILIKKIKFKKLKIKKNILLNKSQKDKIFKSGYYFFEKYYKNYK